MARKRTAKPNYDLEISRLKFKQQQHLADNVTKILQDLIKWGALLGIFYLGYLSIVELAGKITIADIKIAARGMFDFGGGISSITLWITLLAICFGLAGIRFGNRQARLRRESIVHLHEFQLKYEKMIDPKRTSSRLTSTGDTRPEDK